MAAKASTLGLRIAREAFLRADYDACVEILRGRRGAERDFLLARTYLRMRRHDDAERVLRASRAKKRSTWAALTGAAIGRQGDTDGARALIEVALATARTQEERAEARYQRALLHWMLHETDAASAILENEDFGTFSAVAEELRAWLAVERADYASAIRRFEQAATLAGADLMVVTASLSNAAIYAREMYIPAVMSGVLHRVESVARTPYLELTLYQITRAAAWFAAIDGDFARAMQQFSALDSFQVERSWHVFALCDRAYLSLALGEEVNGWLVADQALALADQLEWETFKGSERVALLYLANVFALHRPLQAQRCWRRYKAVPEPGPFSAAFRHEPHVEAWEHFTAGLVEKGLGNAPAAAAHFNRAYSIYRRLGFEWRAVLTLVAERDITPDDRTYDEYIDTVLRRFPNSWLGLIADRERRHHASVTSIA